MSRRKTLPSLSSSRQMMTAWKVSGLSHRPAIIASRPASMRLAMAISPSRDKQLDRAHLAQIHAHRIVGALGRLLGFGLGRRLRRDLDQFAALGLFLLGLLAGALLLVGFGFLGLDDVDAHLADHRQHVLDLLGGDLLGRHDRVELLVGDVAALLGLLDHLLDGGVRQVEQRQRCVRSLGASFSGVSASFCGATSASRPWSCSQPILVAHALALPSLSPRTPVPAAARLCALRPYPMATVHRANANRSDTTHDASGHRLSVGRAGRLQRPSGPA